MVRVPHTRLGDAGEREGVVACTKRLIRKEFIKKDLTVFKTFLNRKRTRKYGESKVGMLAGVRLRVHDRKDTTWIQHGTKWGIRVCSWEENALLRS